MSNPSPLLRVYIIAAILLSVAPAPSQESKSKPLFTFKEVMSVLSTAALSAAFFLDRRPHALPRIRKKQPSTAI